MSRSIWQTLGIKRTHDQKEIRRAYARKLKETNPEDDPDGFKALRAAYEQALAGVDDDAPTFTVVMPQRKPPTASAEDVPPDTTRDPTPNPMPEPAQPAEPDPRQIHAGLQSQLDSLLRGPGSDSDAILAAYNAVMTSPAMAMVEVYAATEDWLAWLIANRSPASDGLIRLAANHFNWGSHSLIQQNQPDIQRVLRRHDDLVFLNGLKKGDSEHHGAYKVLAAPPRPITFLRRLFSLTTPGKISNLLDLLRRDHPTVLADLNRDAVAQWDDFLGQPHLGAWGLRVAVVSPLCLLGMVLGHFLLPPSWRAVTTCLLVPPAFALSSLASAHGAALMQRLSRGLYRYGAPLWLRYGWGLAILAVLAVASLPASPVLALAVALISLIVAVWARTTGEADTSEGKLPWQVRAMASEAYLLAWWAFAAFTLPLVSAVQMSFALAAAVCVSAYGQRPMFELWLSLRRGWRLASCLVVLGLTVGTAVLFYAMTDGFLHSASWPHPYGHGQVAAVIASVVLLHRPMTPLLGPWAFRLKWYSMMALIWIGLHGGVKYLFVAGGALLLFWVAVTMIVVMVREARSQT